MGEIVDEAGRRKNSRYNTHRRLFVLEVVGEIVDEAGRRKSLRYNTHRRLFVREVVSFVCFYRKAIGSGRGYVLVVTSSEQGSTTAKHNTSG